MPSEAWLALILAILVLLVFVGFRLVRLGADRANRKHLEREVKAHAEFEKDGEAWDAGVADRSADDVERLRKLKGSL